MHTASVDVAGSLLTMQVLHAAYQCIWHDQCCRQPLHDLAWRHLGLPLSRDRLCTACLAALTIELHDETLLQTCSKPPCALHCAPRC